MRHDEGATGKLDRRRLTRAQQFLEKVVDDMDNSDTAGAAFAVFAGFGVLWLFVMLVGLAMFAFEIYMYMQIARKAGWPGTYALFLLIPGAGLVLVIMMAFTDWPIHRELAALRAQVAWQNAGNGYPQQGPQLGAPALGAPQPPDSKPPVG